MWKLIKLSLVFCLLSSTSLHAGEDRWTSRGPYGTGGSDSGIFTFHPTNPNLIFVSMFGGVWRSINAGEKWQKIYFDKENPNLQPFYQKMIAPHLAIHPKKPSTIIAVRFFGFLSNGVITVFRSTDRGTNWEVIHQTIESPWNQFTSVTDVQFHSQDPSILYVSFYHKGMIKSTDGGKTWQTINTGLPYQEFEGSRYWDCVQIAVDPTNGDKVYILMQDGKVYKSENAGATWNPASEGLGLQNGKVIKIVSNNPQVLYAGGKGGIYKTTDGGSHWENMLCKCEPASLAIDPSNSNVLYYTDWVKWSRFHQYHVFASRNAGTRWLDLSFPSYRASNAQIAVHPLKHNHLLIEDDEGVYHSNNFGKSWRPAMQGINNEPIGRIAVDPTNAGHILAARSDILGLGYGRIFESKNGGGSWRTLLRSPFQITDIQFHPSDPNVIVAAGGGIGISSDGGLTWHLSEGGSIARIALDPNNPDIIYLPTAKSTDRGRTWKQYDPIDPNYYSIFVDPHNGSTLFLISFPPKLLRSTDAAETWTLIGRGFKEWTGDLFFDPLNPRIIYNPGAKGVYKSLDLGETWALKRNGLPASNCCSHLVIDATDSRIIYTVANSNQLYSSKDSGASWRPFLSSGLEKVGVTALNGNPARQGAFFAGTDNGVYVFTPRGTNNTPP